MARTHRAQVLMEPEEYRQLETLAAAQGVSVSSLVRQAVRERFHLVTTDERRRAVEEIVALDVPDLPDDARDLAAEIEESRASGLP